MARAPYVISKCKEKIIDYLTIHGEVRRKEIYDFLKNTLGASRVTAWRALKELEAEGKIIFDQINVRLVFNEENIESWIKRWIELRDMKVRLEKKLSGIERKLREFEDGFKKKFGMDIITAIRKTFIERP